MDKASLFAKVVKKKAIIGRLTPHAQHHTPLTAEEVLNSRLVAEPLHPYLCSSIGDGAGAAILYTEEKARRFTSKSLDEVAPVFRDQACSRIQVILPRQTWVTLAANLGHIQAGLGPEDVDLAEVHDAMAPDELYHYEELGFCKEGEGVQMIGAGRTEINGDIPFNPTGGLAAKGHPIAVTGLAQIAEIVWQLRGESGNRRVDDPKVGLVQNSGGVVEDDTAAASIVLLER